MRCKKLMSLIVSAALLFGLCLPVSASRYIGVQNLRTLPSTGTVHVVCAPLIYADESDHIDRIELEKALMGQSIHSLRQFFLTQSNGKLEFVADILPVYRAKQTREAYEGENFQKQLKEMLAYHESTGVDFSKYDNNGDGVIDFVIAPVWLMDPDVKWLVEGYVGNVSDPDFTVSGKYINTYTQIKFRILAEAICHETGHALGFGDYYSWPNDAKKHLGLDLMYHADGSYMNVYEKYIMDWLDPEVVTPEDGLKEITLYRNDLYHLDSEEDHLKAALMTRDETEIPFSEYFMAEYRGPELGVYIWQTNSSVSMKLDNIQTSYWKDLGLPRGNYLVGNKPYVWGIANRAEPGVMVSGDSFPTGDYLDGSNSGLYVELVEAAEDHAVLRVGFQPDSGVGPRVTKTVPASSAVLDCDAVSVALTCDTAAYAGGAACWFENKDTSARVAASVSIKDNIITATPEQTLDEGAPYRLALPAGAAVDSAGNLSEAYQYDFFTTLPAERLKKQYERWSLKQIVPAAAPEIPGSEGLTELREGRLYYGATDLGPAEEAANSVWVTANGDAYILSQRHSGWLGASFPVLTKAARSGGILWQMEYEAEAADITILPSDLSERSFYVQTGGETLRYEYYAEGETTDAQVTASHAAGAYREPFDDLVLSAPEGWDIRYTLDGSDPVLFGAPYEGSIALGRSCVLRAVAEKAGVFTPALEQQYEFTAYDGKINGASIMGNYLNTAFDNGGALHFAKSDAISPDIPGSDFYDFSAFSDLRQVAYANYTAVGLKRGGSIVMTGDPNYKAPTFTPEELEEFLDYSVNLLQVQAATFGLRKDGTAFNWALYNLVDDTALTRETGVVRISAAGEDSLALLYEDGRVKYYGLPAGTILDTGLDGVLDIADTPGYVLALGVDGTLWRWAKDDGAVTRLADNIRDLVKNRYVLIRDKNGRTLRIDPSLDSAAAVMENAVVYADEPLFALGRGDDTPFAVRTDGSVYLDHDTKYNNRGTVNDYALKMEEWNLLPARSVEIEPEAWAVEAGGAFRIPFQFDWIDRKQIAWSSSDERVARVAQNGEVTGLEPGTAVITATNGSASDSVTVTVSEAGRTWPCAVSAKEQDGTRRVTIQSVGFSGTADVLAVYLADGKVAASWAAQKVALEQGGSADVSVPDAPGLRIFVWESGSLVPLAPVSIAE